MFVRLTIILGLTQNNEKTNRKGRKGRREIRVLESYCVSPEYTGIFSFRIKFGDI